MSDHSATRTLLFLSRHDSVRTHIAAGLACRMFAGDLRVLTAGVAPTRVDPIAVEVMREVGIDISDRSPTPLSRIPDGEVDVVINLGEADLLPARFVDCELLDWRLPSARGPDGTDPALVRHIRSELVRRLTVLARVLSEGL
jgi:arsenate reductase (thioredoxin)